MDLGAALLGLLIVVVIKVLVMALTAVGLLQLFDWKYLHFVDTASPCIAVKTCGECTKRQSGVCRFSALPPVAAGLLILMSLPVFFASTQRLHADPGFYALPLQSLNDRFDEMLAAPQKANPSGTPADVSAFHLPEEMLFLEFRVLPVLMALLAAASSKET